MRKKEEIINKSFSILKIHEDKMLEFNNKVETIKKININIKENTNKIEKLKKETALKCINQIHYDNSSINNKIEIYKKSNCELINQRTYLSSGKEQIDYILGSCKIISKYIELEEIEKGLILNETGIEEELYELNIEKNVLIDEYMFLIDPNYVSCRSNTKLTEELYCEDCHVKLNSESGHLVCYNCGKSIPTVQVATDFSYKELQEMDIRTQYTYLKQTHLTEWLRRFQSKEHKEIPQNIIDKVIMEAYKKKVKDLSTLNESDIKKYLKNLGLNDYYDNVIAIINKINKRPKFVLTEEVEQKIKNMFQQTCMLFDKFKASDRKNMLSYSYLLNKYFLILGLPEFSKYFFLLKSPEKLREQDHVFKKIVEELAKIDTKTKWKFYPSL